MSLSFKKQKKICEAAQNLLSVLHRVVILLERCLRSRLCQLRTESTKEVAEVSLAKWHMYIFKLAVGSSNSHFSGFQITLKWFTFFSYCTPLPLLSTGYMLILLWDKVLPYQINLGGLNQIFPSIHVATWNFNSHTWKGSVRKVSSKHLKE